MLNLVARMLLHDAAAIASLGTLTSDAIRLTLMAGLESMMFKVTSVIGTPALKLEYAVSNDGVTFGSFNDETDIIADTSALASPEDWHAIPMPNIPSPYVKFKWTGLAANPADSLLTAKLVYRE